MRTALAQTSIIRLEGDVWAPYVMDPASGHKGLMVDIAELALSRAGYKLSFAAVPWSRSLINARNGRNDGLVGIYFSQAREMNFVVPDEELGISINQLYVKRNSSWSYKGVSSLDSMVLGVVANYDYGELNPYVEKNRVAQSNALQITGGNDALQKNMRMLLLDRITVLVEDAVVFRYAARQLGIEDQVRSAGSIAPTNRVGIAFSRKNPKAGEYAKALSDGIRKLRESGELKVLLDRYEVSDWKQTVR